MKAQCSYCRWWGDSLSSEQIYGVQVEVCTHKMVIRPTYGKGDNWRMRRDGVMTADEGGGTDQLVTGPDFGCIHYERKTMRG